MARFKPSAQEKIIHFGITLWIVETCVPSITYLEERDIRAHPRPNRKMSLNKVRKEGNKQYETRTFLFSHPHARYGGSSCFNSTLPDGTEFPVWEKALHFQKPTTWTCKQRTPTTKARGARSGRSARSARQPRCCNRRTCRHCRGSLSEYIRPARGGTGPEAMISYEAAPGAKVVVKGAAVAKNWKPSEAGTSAWARSRASK